MGAAAASAVAPVGTASPAEPAQREFFFRGPKGFFGGGQKKFLFIGGQGEFLVF